jgi:uncharacterized membrane protein YGL010W
MMNSDSKLMDMLTGYASAHQHPFNVAVHMIGIPTIMLGVFIVLSWLEIGFRGFIVNGAHLATLILFVFYLTLDVAFALVFLLYAVPIAWIATVIGAQSLATSGTVAAATFFGGYAAQFVGHAVERSVPVILKHPVQANLAAPFFTVVEIFKILGLRDDLFNEVQRRISEMRQQQAA